MTGDSDILLCVLGGSRELIHTAVFITLITTLELPRGNGLYLCHQGIFFCSVRRRSSKFDVLLSLFWQTLTLTFG